ncbi:hypothetical protein Tco_0215683 [Tanacetum coccineum]
MGTDLTVRLRRESKYTFLSENIRSGALVGQGSALIACLRIRTLFRRRPTEAVRVRLVILEPCRCSPGLNIGSLYLLLILFGPRPNCEGTAQAQKPDFVVSLDFASATGGFSVTLLINQPSVNLFRAFYTSSYTKGWLSFIKRSDAAPVCHSKPLDSVKNWNDHFFWVDSTAFPLSVTLKSKLLSKDPPPKLSQYETEACGFLQTHTAPFRNLELFVFVYSRYYTLDEHSYPTFWDGDEGWVRVGERNLVDRELKLLKITEGRTVTLDPPATTVSRGSSDSIYRLFDERDNARTEHYAEEDYVQYDVIAKDASEVVVKKPQKKRKRKVIRDASGSALPPKRLRDDH